MINWDDYFYYDETSPSGLRWLNGNGYKMQPNSVAGGIGHGGYYTVELNNKPIRCHKIVYEITSGTKLQDGYIVDHIDGNNQNNVSTNLRVVDRAGNSRNTKKYNTNKSSKTGVCLDQKSKGKYYWVASWNGFDRKQRHKSFSVSTYGYDEAFKMACEYRDKMIGELNEQGAGYTERHGT